MLTNRAAAGHLRQFPERDHDFVIFDTDALHVVSKDSKIVKLMETHMLANPLLAVVVVDHPVHVNFVDCVDQGVVGLKARELKTIMSALFHNVKGVKVDKTTQSLVANSEKVMTC